MLQFQNLKHDEVEVAMFFSPATFRFLPPHLVLAKAQIWKIRDYGFISQLSSSLLERARVCALFFVFSIITCWLRFPLSLISSRPAPDGDLRRAGGGSPFLKLPPKYAFVLGVSLNHGIPASWCGFSLSCPAWFCPICVGHPTLGC